jgi:hypothetical protein
VGGLQCLCCPGVVFDDLEIIAVAVINGILIAPADGIVRF